MRRFRAALLLALPLVVAACAGTPRFENAEGTAQLTPREVARNPAAAVGKEVLWGGVVVNTSNLEDATQIEVLGYPLTDEQRPALGQEPVGRFLAIQEGYLETADFTSGRPITVRGTVTGVTTGKIGAAEYMYPMVRISDVQLWQRERRERSGFMPNFHFGLGVLFGD